MIILDFLNVAVASFIFFPTQITLDAILEACCQGQLGGFFHNH